MHSSSMENNQTFDLKDVLKEEQTLSQRKNDPKIHKKIVGDD